MEQQHGVSSEYRVHVVEGSTRSRRGVISCEIGRGRNISFSSEGLASYCFARWEPIVFDMLLLAAAVEFCDRNLRRPPKTWARKITLRLPVHDVGRWKSASVVDTLNAATTAANK